MKSTYRIKLFVALLVFAIVITFSIATIDYIRLKERAIKDNENQIEHATELVKYALKTIDKAYLYLDEETAEKMVENTFSLQEEYEKNADFNKWDFTALALDMEMDIYIINSENKIIHSNDVDEVGLDFSDCCASFDEVLTKRRASGELFVDGIDIDQQTGETKKFSYMATKDKEYIIELGYSLENEPIFKEFNFIKITEELENDFSLIEGLHVLNLGGLPFGGTDEEALTPERRAAFEIARDSNETVEINSEYHGKDVVIRYIPYESDYDIGSTKIKVLEIAYNKQELTTILKENQQSFYTQLALILIVTAIVSSVIANWFARPIHLAYHDSLTGLKNRASFDEYLEEALTDEKPIALFMMDLDNFKLVNDFLGHIKGDHLLQVIAKTIRSSVGMEDEVFRLGGDEFAVVIKNAKKEEVEELAQYIIDTLEVRIDAEEDIKTLSVTLSIGVVLSEKDSTLENLYKQADIALYESKEKGKNQFQLYGNGTLPTIPFTS